MKFLLLILSVVVCGAAPNAPEFSRLNLSPRAAATISQVRMAKFKPAGSYDEVPGLAPTRFSLMENFNGKDVALIEAIQRANTGVRFEFTDGTPSKTNAWILIVARGPYPEEQPVGTEWSTSISERSGARFFRVVEVPSAALARSVRPPEFVANPALRDIRVSVGGKWSVPKRP